MFCPRCGSHMGERARFCPGCGSKKKKFSFGKMIISLSMLSIVVFGGIIAYMFFNPNKEKQIQMAVSPTKTTNEEEQKVAQTVALPKKLSTNEKKKLTEVIAEKQSKVYTIYTNAEQGSGFLVNKKGDVVTNAHVVEGASTLSIKDKNGNAHEGQLIGYSNTIDVAVIRVPDLAGKSPLALETGGAAEVGEEVIALGSPLSLENTATFGYITGVDRSFYIGNRSYDGIYQTSAAIAPGSSGGPLVSKETGKVLAINSAKLNGQDAIGFSIPLRNVYDLIQQWINNPMSEEEIHALFYNEAGNLFYQEFWDDEAYFEGGEYSEEEEYNVPLEEVYEDEPIEDEYVEEEYTDEEYIEEESEELYDDSESVDVSEEHEDPAVEEELPEEETPVIEDINGDGIIDENDLIDAGTSEY